MNDYKGYHYKVANLAQKTIPGNESLIVSIKMIDTLQLRSPNLLLSGRAFIS